MQLKEYSAVIRRRWLIILAAVLAAVVSGYVFAKAQTPIYRSLARLEVSGRIDYGQTLAITALLRQMAARVRTDSVAREVDRRYKLDLGPETLLEKVHTQAFPDTIQIQIEVDDVSPERARIIALGLAQAFEEQQSARMAGVAEQERINVSLLDQPRPGNLNWPQTRVIVAAGAILGLLVGLLLAFLFEYLDDTIKTTEDVDTYLALPNLGSIPRVKGAQVAAVGKSPAPAEAERR